MELPKDPMMLFSFIGEEQKSIVAILIEKLQEKKQMTVQVSDAE